MISDRSSAAIIVPVWIAADNSNKAGEMIEKRA